MDGTRHGSVPLPLGVLNDDGTVEIRGCEDCGTKVETEPLFTAPLGDATRFFD